MIRPHYVPLYQSVCHSKRLADLPDHGARLFYLLLLTHCDAYGRCTACPRVLRAKVWAMYDEPLSRVEKYLAALARVGLIVLYEHDGEPVLAIPDWEEKAGKVGRPDRRGEQTIPPPPAGVVPHDDESRGSSPATTPSDCGSSPASRARLDPIRSDPIRSDPRDVVAEATVPPKAPRAPATGPHAEFVAWWTEAFQNATGAPYGFQGAKDGKHVKTLLERTGGDLEALKTRASILLHAAPGWIAEGGKDLGTLVQHWNKLVSQGSGAATGAKLLAAGIGQPPPKTMADRLAELPPSPLELMPSTKPRRPLE